jgi:hypothetical protein
VTALEQLEDGLWRWTLRHPDWHPRTEFGAEVACFAVRDGDGTVLIDPLFDDAVAERLDAVVDGTVTVAITVPYHVRSAAAAARRWDARIVGHPDLARRLEGLSVDEAAPGVRLFPIPRHKERPVEVARSLAFGDRVVGVDGGLRIWAQRQLDERHRGLLRRWLEPLLEHDFERVLVTHGAPVLKDGRAALAEALDAEPWYHRPS